MHAYNTDKGLYDSLRQHPSYPEQFSFLMQGYQQGQPSLADPTFYPVRSALVQGFKYLNEGVMIVDLGGSAGHDLQKLLAAYPDIPGRIVLQDLPHVLQDSLEGHGRVEKVSYNFFDKQPLKGQ